MPDSISESSILAMSEVPKTTYVLPEYSPFGAASTAPIITSSRPSPLISPAATLSPMESPASTPLITKPELSIPDSVSERSISTKTSPVPKTTYVLPDQSPFGSAPFALIITSS